MKVATFAGGCFWCMVPPFEKLSGIISIKSGYAGGTSKNPTYEDVCSHKTDHIEAVQVEYDESRVTYEQLLNAFWHGIDPTDNEGQFADKGPQYKSAIFYHDKTQQIAAEKSKKDLSDKKVFAKPIVTSILKHTIFYPAEDYHQDYHKKNPLRYKSYRYFSGRDTFLEKAWSKEK